MRSQHNRTSRYQRPPPRFAMPKVPVLPARDFRIRFARCLWMARLAAGMALLIGMLFAAPLQAQPGIYAAGDAIVTGFSGVSASGCRARDLAKIIGAAGGSDQNANPADDDDEGVAIATGRECGGLVLVRERACPSAYRWDGQRCVRGVTLLPMPRDGCRRGFWRTQGHCCPLGQGWDGKRCGAPTQDGPECPHGVTGVYPDCVAGATRRCPSGFSGRPPICCPPATRFEEGRCVKRDETADSQCGRGRYMSEGHCCPRGTIWNGKRCLRNPGLQPSCPPGTVGTFPNCRTLTGRTCSLGTTGRFPDCEAVRRCPAGTAGAWPNCRPFQAERCPPGTRGAYPNCIPTARNCPPGTFGVPPICRTRDARPCPAGTVGSGGRCLQLQRPRPLPQLRQPNPIDLQRQRAR
jgi:hypothetical protein